MPSVYEILEPDGHKQFAEDIFSKLKTYMESTYRPQTDYDVWVKPLATQNNVNILLAYDYSGDSTSVKGDVIRKSHSLFYIVQSKILQIGNLQIDGTNQDIITTSGSPWYSSFTSLRSAISELNSRLVPIIKSKDGFTFIATKLSETHYLIEMLFQSRTGITASGVTLPFSVKPLRTLLFTGKANDGSDKWYIPFRLTTSGTLDARSNDNNSSIAVTWVAIHVVFIGTANFS